MFSERTNWPLATNRLTQVLQALRSAGTPVLDLTVSNPTRCGFKYSSAEILGAFQNAQMLDYEPQAMGLRSAREAVVEYYRLDHNAKIDAESVGLTTSTSEAYSFVFRLLCNPGDEV